jgi:hypothetical protein
MVKEPTKTKDETKCRAGILPALHFIRHGRLNQLCHANEGWVTAFAGELLTLSPDAGRGAEAER